jgi:hypothetical protein
MQVALLADCVAEAAAFVATRLLLSLHYQTALVADVTASRWFLVVAVRKPGVSKLW